MKLTSLVLLLSSALACLAQGMLNNDSVIKMWKGGVGEEVILTTIKASPASFTTSPDDLLALKRAGVTDKIVEAMIAKRAAGAGRSGGKNAANAPATPAAAAPSAAPPLVHEIGVYVLKDNAWTDLSPELINWKTVGVLKSIGTVGLIKEDRSGHLNGLHSGTPLPWPVTLLVYTPPDTAISEYRLIRLHQTKDIREFRTGVDGGKTAGGLVPFDSTKIAERTYQIKPRGSDPGEYGLMPAGQVEKVTKLYTYRVE
jgi:hypothetical protein